MKIPKTYLMMFLCLLTIKTTGQNIISGLNTNNLIQLNPANTGTNDCILFVRKECMILFKLF